MTDLDAPVREPSRARATFSTEASRPLRAARLAAPPATAGGARPPTADAKDSPGVFRKPHCANGGRYRV